MERLESRGIVLRKWRKLNRAMSSPDTPMSNLHSMFSLSAAKLGVNAIEQD